MSKANEPAYPVVKTNHKYGTTNNERWDYGDTYSEGGPTKREKLAMEIYARATAAMIHLPEAETFDNLRRYATDSLRAADIFFEQLEKNKMV